MVYFFVIQIRIFNLFYDSHVFVEQFYCFIFNGYESSSSISLSIKTVKPTTILNSDITVFVSCSFPMNFLANCSYSF